MPLLYHHVVPSLEETESSEYKIGNFKQPDYKKAIKDLLEKKGISAKVIKSDDPIVNYNDKPCEPDEAYSCILVTDKPIPDSVMNTLKNEWDFAVERDTTCYGLSKNPNKLSPKALTKIIKALDKKSLKYVKDGARLYFELEKPLTDKQKKQIANVGGIIEPVLACPQ